MKPSGRRIKGKTVELKVVHELIALGYPAKRIPFSGAGHEKGDVKIEKPGTRFGETFNEAHFWMAEVKARASEFDTIYRLVEIYLEKEGCFQLHVGNRKCYISYRFIDLPKFGNPDIFSTVELHLDKDGIPSMHPANRLMRFKGTYMKDCDLLVIKGNRKPLLYITYEENEKTSKLSGDIGKQVCCIGD